MCARSLPQVREASYGIETVILSSECGYGEAISAFLVNEIARAVSDYVGNKEKRSSR